MNVHEGFFPSRITGGKWPGDPYVITHEKCVITLARCGCTAPTCMCDLRRDGTPRACPHAATCGSDAARCRMRQRDECPRGCHGGHYSRAVRLLASLRRGGRRYVEAAPARHPDLRTYVRCDWPLLSPQEWAELRDEGDNEIRDARLSARAVPWAEAPEGWL